MPTQGGKQPFLCTPIHINNTSPHELSSTTNKPRTASVAVLHRIMEQQYPSALLEKAVSEFSRLPGIGRKTALRLVLHLLKTRVEDVENFSSSILKVRKDIKYCQLCHNISDTETCAICANPRRDAATI